MDNSYSITIIVRNGEREQRCFRGAYPTKLCVFCAPLPRSSDPFGISPRRSTRRKAPTHTFTLPRLLFFLGRPSPPPPVSTHSRQRSSLKFVNRRGTLRKILILQVFPPRASYTTTCGFKTNGTVEEDFEEF